MNNYRETNFISKDGIKVATCLLNEEFEASARIENFWQHDFVPFSTYAKAMSNDKKYFYFLVAENFMKIIWYRWKRKLS
ncbi:MAG: hypothetical protein Q4B60_08930 [Erysipelotrichaceae bacterium]|nr:hypothetical protein [Erysipelotrichaceae bacterium]